MNATILEDLNVLEELKNNLATPCVSVIIPSHKVSPDRAIDGLEVKKMLKKAKKLVNDMYGLENGSEEILNKLDDLAGNIDYLHNDMGLGFFVSPTISHMVKFPFTVTEKVIVGKNFEIRDMIYLAETMINYYVLSINEKEIKLFEGNGTNLKLLNDQDFPMHFFDDYEYARASLGSSYGYSLKSTEKDKSIVKEQRLTAYYKVADQKISKYLINNTPLILAGSSKDLGYFKKASINYKYVVGKINGNYINENNQKLGQFSFEKIKEFLNLEADKLLIRLDDALGKKLAVYGIVNVWKASQEGKGLILLVEKDYEIPGFITDDASEIFLHPPKKPHEIIKDAVDDVMETVIGKNGKVVIVENGKLVKFEGIALILRYW